jgi:hypothetical protein
MRPTALVRLYPRSWQQRYGDEMRATLEDATIRRSDLVDLARGALDAWLHPATPSRIPAAAAIVGGGIWTIVAAAVVFQPIPLDWPGYLAETVLLAAAAAVVLLIATLGCALRAGDDGGPAMTLAAWVTVVGYVAWLTALLATTTGVADAPTLAAAQTIAMLGTLLVGLLLVRAGDELIGLLVLGGAVAMLVPWVVAWLVFGAAWTAVGMVLVTERPRRLPPRWEIA